MTGIPGDIPKRFISQLENDLFGCFSTEGRERPGTDILDGLNRVMEIMSEPVPVSVWFIDRMASYCQLESMCEPNVDSHDMGSALSLPYAGLPIYCWNLDDLLKHINESRTESIERFKMTPEQVDDVQRRSFPIRQPGVWMVWNTGDVQRIVLQ